MRDSIINLFGNYSHEIIFIHVISAVIWIGGMIILYIAVNPTFQLIDKVPVRLDKITILLGKFFNFSIIFIILSVITAVFMIIGMGFKAAAMDSSGDIISELAMDTYRIIYLKEAIWLLMVINFTYMYIKVKKAKKLLKLKKINEAQESIEKLPTIFLPINIALGVITIWLGVSLRGF